MQTTVYCVITFFPSYPRTSIPSIPSVQFVMDDDNTGIVVLSGDFTAAEFRALIRGAMDIESAFDNDLDNDDGGGSGGTVEIS